MTTSPPARDIFCWSIWNKLVISFDKYIFKEFGSIQESLDLQKEQHRPHDRARLKLLSSNQVQAQQANWVTEFQNKLQQQSLLFQLLQAKYLRLNHQRNSPTLKMSIPWLKMEYSKWIQVMSKVRQPHWLKGAQQLFAEIYRLHRCWWRMLETECVGDNFQMLMTDSGFWWPIKYIEKITKITKKSPT